MEAQQLLSGRPGESAPAPRTTLAHRLGWLCGGLILAAALCLQSGRPASTLTAAQPTRHTKRMDQIKVGDVVVARDEQTGEVAPRRVTKVFRRKSNHLRYLTFESADGTPQIIKTTDEHPFYSLDHQKFVPAGELHQSDSVTGPDGTTQSLIETRREEFAQGIEVFNFQVDGFHTYFVSANGQLPAIWVHNADYPEGTDQFRRVGRWFGKYFEGHHPVPKWMRDVLEQESQVNVRLPSGRRIGQRLVEIDGNSHSEQLHGMLKRANLEYLRGKDELRQALRDRTVTPTQVLDDLQDFYRHLLGTGEINPLQLQELLNSMSTYRSRLGI